MDLKFFVLCHLVPWILACAARISFEGVHLASVILATSLTPVWGTLWLRAFTRFFFVLAVLFGLERLDSRFNSH